MKIYVDGKLLPAAQVLMKDGVTYVEAATIAEAMGGTAQSGPTGYLITTTSTSSRNECDHSSPQGQKFSDEFRGDTAGVADEIESLRAVILKTEKGKDKEREKVPLGPRFDAIDKTLRTSKLDIKTDADAAVYYALSYANNSLAISYYKQQRDIPTEAEDQLDSMICSMESKFALMKGVLMPGGMCSVFKRIEAQGIPKAVEVTHQPTSEQQN